MFPDRTKYGKRVPKQSLYSHLHLDSSLKQIVQDFIKLIRWEYVLKERTLNLPRGRVVEEIEVLGYELKENTDMEPFFRQMDREIPYHLVHILCYDGRAKIYMAYKEPTQGKNFFRVDKYYCTDWLAEEEIPLSIEGLDLDDVYENFLRQVAGAALPQAKEDESLKESVEREQEIAVLDKELQRLEAAKRKESQFKRKVEINNEIKKLKRKRLQLVGSD